MIIEYTTVPIQDPFSNLSEMEERAQREASRILRSLEARLFGIPLQPETIDLDESEYEILD